jgi:hypothetical protein
MLHLLYYLQKLENKYKRGIDYHAKETVQEEFKIPVTTEINS